MAASMQKLPREIVLHFSSAEGRLFEAIRTDWLKFTDEAGAVEIYEAPGVGKITDPASLKGLVDDLAAKAFSDATAHHDALRKEEAAHRATQKAVDDLKAEHDHKLRELCGKHCHVVGERDRLLKEMAQHMQALTEHLVSLHGDLTKATEEDMAAVMKTASAAVAGDAAGPTAD